MVLSLLVCVTCVSVCLCVIRCGLWVCLSVARAVVACFCLLVHRMICVSVTNHTQVDQNGPSSRPEGTAEDGLGSNLERGEDSGGAGQEETNGVGEGVSHEDDDELDSLLQQFSVGG